MSDEQGLSAANRRLVQLVTPSIDTEWETMPILRGELNALLNAARADARFPPPGEVREEVARRIEVILRDEIGRQFSAARDDGLNDVRIATIVPRATGRILALSASPIQGGGWRPIEEAPAENALLYWPETNTLCERWSIGLPHHHGAHRSPSHFWPLPAPPVPTEEG